MTVRSKGHWNHSERLSQAVERNNFNITKNKNCIALKHIKYAKEHEFIMILKEGKLILEIEKRKESYILGSQIIHEENFLLWKYPS